jgi:biotin operon repressor
MSDWSPDRAAEAAPVVLEVFKRWRKSRNALSRQDLVGMTGLSDRLIRSAIAELRRQGYLIIADENGGYRFARSVDEVLAYTASLKSRVDALREVVTAMESAAEDQFGSGSLAQQMSMF